MIDLRDVILEAQAEVQAIVREVVEDLITPQIHAQVRMQWAQMPDAAREQFAAERPQEYAEVMKIIRR
jgi:hypothetical protein